MDNKDCKYHICFNASLPSIKSRKPHTINLILFLSDIGYKSKLSFDISKLHSTSNRFILQKNLGQLWKMSFDAPT